LWRNILSHGILNITIVLTAWWGVNKTTNILIKKFVHEIEAHYTLITSNSVTYDKMLGWSTIQARHSNQKSDFPTVMNVVNSSSNLPQWWYRVRVPHWICFQSPLVYSWLHIKWKIPSISLVKQVPNRLVICLSKFY